MDRELEPADFFVLRTPLLPFDEFLRWGDDADRALLRERLLEAVRRPELREAVYLSSPAVVALLDGDDGDVLRVERALVRYFSRATGRATPHGLLAGVSWGRVGDRTELVLAGRETYSRRARLSLEFLLELVELLGAEPNAQEEDRYRANGTIYWAAGRVRYIGGGSRRRHSHLELRSVSAHPSVEAVVAKAQQPATRDELATAASVDRRLVGRMIEAGLLVPDRRVPLTGDLHDAGLWPARGTRGGPENTVAECESLLASLSGDPPGVATRSYDEIARRLGGLGVSESTARFRVDLEKPAHTATLGRDVAREIARGVTLLHRITRHAPPDPELAHFVERFRERFADREVPLLEALDSEVGAGFGPGPELDETLLTGIRESRSGDAGWGPRERLLARRLPAALQAGGAELVLSARDVEELAAAAGPHLPLPDELAAIAVVAAESAQALALGSFQVLVKGYGGPGGVGAAARFCRTPEQAELVREHLRREESLDEDALFAEIVHLPSEPHADLVARPLLRDYEIVCAGASGAPAERQIDLSDLQLALDPSGALVLRSRRLARRIIPRLTNPHNFMLFGAKPYRFLCKLQFQRTSGRVDFWGPLAELPRLPRVRSGRIVLQRASWRITSRDLAGDPLTALGRWRHENDVPRLVALVELDRELPVDLDNPFSAGALADRLLALGEVLLVEWFPDPDRLCVRGPEGRFVHELLVPFVRTAPSVAPPRAQRPAAAPSSARVFPPGSAWTYLKLFASPPAVDRILVEELAPLMADLEASGAVDRWFFVRYDQPDFHLRVRCRGGPVVRQTLEAASARLLDRRLVWQAELGTYVRELERYGGAEAIEHAEAVFHADSAAVVELLGGGNTAGAGAASDLRWQLALYGAHVLLLDLGIDRVARYDIVRSSRDALADEYGLSRREAGNIGSRFRQERQVLAALVCGDVPAAGRVFERRSQAVRASAEGLKRLERAAALTRPRQEIAASLVHMHLNRFLRSRHREQELVILEFLSRLYRAEL